MSSPPVRYNHNRIVRRMASLPRSIIGGISRAMGDGMGLVGIGRRRNNHHHHSNFHAHPPSLLPQHDPLLVPEKWAFLNNFEHQYGTKHPFFYACRFTEAMKLAEQDHKFMFMYLHSLDHPFADVFCKETLCSELVTEFLDVNFVCWGALADRGEGQRMAAMLRPASFPCCVVIAPSPEDSMTVLQQLEGPLSPAELVEILQRTLEEQGVAFGSAKAKQEEKIRAERRLRDQKIQADRRLKEEQDAAYLAALQLDKEKEKHKSSPSRVGVQKPEAAQNARNIGKLSTNSVNVSKQNNNNNNNNNNNKVNESIGHKQVNGTASRGSDSQATQILIRFPNGERREHTFLCNDKIQSIFSYIDSLGMPGVGNYRLITNFPRRAYGVDQMRMTLKEAGLYPKASMFLEPV